MQNQPHIDVGTSKPCRTCKWQMPNPAVPRWGQCTADHYAMCWLRDVENFTCKKHEGDKLSFCELNCAQI